MNALTQGIATSAKKTGAWPVAQFKVGLSKLILLMMMMSSYR